MMTDAEIADVRARYTLVDDFEGYKAVVNPDRWGWVVMSFKIPKGSIVIPCEDHIYRTDICIPDRFMSPCYKHSITKTVFCSWFDRNFMYEIGKKATSAIDYTVGKSCLQGIHFFCDIQSAVNFGNVNFGSNAAM